MNEKIESWDEILEFMGVSGELSTLRDLKHAYGLNAQRVKGIVIEFDPSVRREAKESIDYHYPYLRGQRNDQRMRLGLPPEGWHEDKS